MPATNSTTAALRAQHSPNPYATMSTTSGFSLGLKGVRPKKPIALPKPGKPLALFATADDDAGSTEDADDEGVGIFGAAARKNQPSGTNKKGGEGVSTVNAQLATFNELSKKAAKASAEVDPSIYDYDSVWEDMKAVDRKKKKEDELDALERKPKYMENLLASAEVRKRDLLRAKERLLQKEREEEGDEFKDKESFVTGAYKKQQEELQRLEEEERLREENHKKRSQGMSSFHRNMLNKLEIKHDQLVSAAESKDKDRTEVLVNKDVYEDAETEAAERARALQEKGAAIDINEEGLVVDKTQLLSGGLNVAVKKSIATDRASVEARRSRPAYQGQNKIQQDVRARQSRMLEDQLAQSQKRALEEEEKAKADLERQSKSRKTETDVISAKERYLQRKAAAAAAEAEQINKF